MAVDYISMLNAGSGLNTTQIVDALVDAERVPREEKIQAQVEEANVSISGLGKVKQGFGTLSSALDGLDGETGLIATSSSTAASVTITDKAIVTEQQINLEVSQIARSQTLVFDGFTSATDNVGTGSLNFEFGTWASGSFSANSAISSTSLTVANGADTLSEVRDQINAANMGVTASIIQTGTGAFSLVMKSQTGADRAMRVTATESPADSGLNDIDFSTYDADEEAQSAQNAVFTLDGVSITRNSNEIDDVMDGMRLNLIATTSAPTLLTAKYDTATATAAMQLLVDELNILNTSLSELTSNGLNGTSERGALYGDALVQSYKNRLRALTTTPIAGFGADPVYLTNFGIKTERNGSLTLDTAKFESAFESNPEQFAAIVNTQATTNNPSVTASISGDNFTPGSYAFTAASGVGTVGSDSMTAGTSSFISTTGDTSGLTLSTSASDITAQVYMGRSLVNDLSNFADLVLGSGNDIDRKIATLNSDIDDRNLEISNLSTRMEDVRDRYVKQFAAMEQAVKSLKETGSYIESFMDSWRAGQD
jgi:flagellar hook-associated protein 2